MIQVDGLDSLVRKRVMNIECDIFIACACLRFIGKSIAWSSVTIDISYNKIIEETFCTTSNEGGY